jgi:hypothetical protein
MATITAKLLVACPYKEDTLPASTDPKQASSSLGPPRSNFLELRNDEVRRKTLPLTPVKKVQERRIHEVTRDVYFLRDIYAIRTGGSPDMVLKRFAQILGVVLIVIGIVGLLVLGNEVWLGLLNTDVVEDIVHIVTGGLLAYVGFGRTDLATTRNLVLALGVIYLVVGILGFVVPMMFGLIPHGYTLFDDLLHLVLGILSIAVALTASGASTARGARA